MGVNLGFFYKSKGFYPGIASLNETGGFRFGFLIAL